jgi:DNA-binding response OmpR family regulator
MTDASKPRSAADDQRASVGAAPGLDPARALLVASHSEIAARVKQCLGSGPFIVREMDPATGFQLLIEQWRPHLVLIELDEDQQNLLDWLAETAPPGVRMPVLALDGRNDIQRRVVALKRGVDDIVVTPFSAEEFSARASALVRRAYRQWHSGPFALEVGSEMKARGRSRPRRLFHGARERALPGASRI